MRTSTSLILLLGLGTACRAPSSASNSSSPVVESTPAPPLEVPAQAPAEESTGDLRAAATAAYEAKDWARCVEAYEQMLDRAGATGTDAYNGACCLALAGRFDRAFDRLEQAAALGMRSVDHLRADSDLASLHEHLRWPDTVALYQARLDEYLASINRELYEIYQADQGDRRLGPEDIDWTVVSARDQQRRARVLEIVDAGGAKVGDDWFHAAMVMQHGEGSEDYRRAHEWARQAAELSPELAVARWLAAAAKDRWLMHEGKPQRYGTQFTNKDGRWELYEVDPSVTDEERQQWNVPPLAEAQRRAEQMNER